MRNIKMFESFLDIKESIKIEDYYEELPWGSPLYERVVPRFIRFSNFFIEKITELLNSNGYVNYNDSMDPPNYLFAKRDLYGNRAIKLYGNKNWLQIKLSDSSTHRSYKTDPKVWTVEIEVDDDDYYWVHLNWQSLGNGTQKTGYENKIYRCDQLDGLLMLLKIKGVIK